MPPALPQETNNNEQSDQRDEQSHECDVRDCSNRRGRCRSSCARRRTRAGPVERTNTASKRRDAGGRGRTARRSRGRGPGEELNNPISDLVSVPFQFNWENGIGRPDRTRFILNNQPVMPFTLNERWNLIALWR
jgi:hypothetical protein